MQKISGANRDAIAKPKKIQKNKGQTLAIFFR